MALIKCPECGTGVSERAASCPICGCPLQGDGCGTAHLVFLRKHFATPYQSITVDNENGQRFFDVSLVGQLPKNTEKHAEIRVVGPTEISVNTYEYTSGLFSSGHKCLHSDSCIVKPGHTYLISDSSAGSYFTISEIN